MKLGDEGKNKKAEQPNEKKGKEREITS